MKILNKLNEDRTVNFELNEEKTILAISECGEYYYESHLTKIEFNQLLEELNELYNQML